QQTRAAQGLLARAPGDQEKEIRQLAIEALVIDDAQVALTQALDSEHNDVVVRAAKALARHGLPAALQPLLRLATAPEPQEKERVSDWSALVDAALEGLEELGSHEAVSSLVPILDNKVQHAS